MRAESAQDAQGAYRAALKELLFSWADNELVLGHRISEWTGHAPILEEDIAFSNLAQDEIGHAQAYYLLLHQLGEAEPDQLAFMRGADAFTSSPLVEYPKGDWAFTVTRQYLYDQAERVWLEAAKRSSYAPLAEYAHKIGREEMYHQMHSKGWVERLGDATEESKRRMQAALEALWQPALDLFAPYLKESELVAGEILAPTDALLSVWLAEVTATLEQSGLKVPVGRIPQNNVRYQHTEHLAPLLDDMQQVFRLAPQAAW